MKAILQNFKNGELSVAEVPPPAGRARGLLVRNAASLISAGTEKAVIELARMNPLQKARARPDLVRKVLQRAGQEGILGTLQTIFNLISAPLPLGYSCAGIVESVGEQVSGFSAGQAVACAGLGYANHAEVVYIPRNLAVAVPENVSLEEASFVTLGAIALQGVRQADLRLGERVVVFGLGLVGQLTLQIVGASGCRAFGLDLDEAKVTLARELGAAGAATLEGDTLAAVRRFTRDRGADAILVCAATSSNEPVTLAAQLARDRARVVAVGDVGLAIPRRPYFEKELDLRLSRSYGPGRYDRDYEEHGQDYPIGYVRWTENRNMEAFLDLLAEKKVRVEPLVTHRYPIAEAKQAYALLTGERKEPYLGVVLEYDTQQAQPGMIEMPQARPAAPVTGSGNARGPLRLGVIGAGTFAQGVLLPLVRRLRGVEIAAVATASGISARGVAERYRARFCTADYREIVQHQEIDAVLIATRHELHAGITCEALAAGKHVFVEKPLALTEAELGLVLEAFQSAQQKTTPARPPILMVGYNRRFSPYARLLREELRRTAQPLYAAYRVNAGPVPRDSWVQDPQSGGGRIVGELCHFVDLLHYLTGSRPSEVFAAPLLGVPTPPADSDHLAVTLRFENGSLATIAYVANGDPRIPKERLEIFCGGRTALIDNWRALRLSGGGKILSRRNLLFSQKGHAQELSAFAAGAAGGECPIPVEEIAWGMATVFAIRASLRTGSPVVPHLPGVGKTPAPAQ
jgi:predicted dehydrogenase/threonine dehydrogenase-like Zn-dependent dehydrogenase